MSGVGLLAAYEMLGMSLAEELGAGTVKSLGRVVLRNVAGTKWATREDGEQYAPGPNERASHQVPLTLICGILTDFPLPTDEAELWDCDVILVPKVRRRDTAGNTRGMSADGLLTGGGIWPSNYEEVTA